MTTTISNWQFISLWCRFRGYWNLAKFSKKIDNALKELYGNTATEKWKTYYKRNKRELFNPFETTPAEILTIITCTSFNRACVESNGYCIDCKFSQKYGDCRNPNSLIRQFIDEFTLTFFKRRWYFVK